MIGIVFQDPPPRGKKLYGKRPIRKTVIVQKSDVVDLLLTEERSFVMNGSWDTQIVGEENPENIPTVLWAKAVRTRDFVATTYPHHLRPLTTLEKKASLESDETRLRNSLAEKLESEGLEPAQIRERLKDIKHWGLEVPPEIVEWYNLRDGYEIELAVLRNYRNIQNNNLLVISKVNGEENPEIIRNFPLPIGVIERGVKRLQKSYPRRMIELDRFGSSALRMFYLLGAALGFGQVVYLRGEGGLGKTGISLDAWKAVLRLTLEEPKAGEKPVFAFLNFCGERDEDLDDLYLRAKEETPHNPSRVEIVAAPKSVNPINQWQVFEYAISRIRVLGLSYNVVALYDSGPRAVEAYSDIADSGAPMVSGGVVKKAITDVARMVGTGGFFPETNTSVTQIVLTLDGDPKDPATMLDRLTKDHNTTGLWSLTRSATEWPPINVMSRETSVRRVQLHINPVLLEESQYVLGVASKSISGDGTDVSPEVKYARVIEYVRRSLLPAYVTSKKFSKTSKEVTLWEQAIAYGERIERPVSESSLLAFDLFAKLLSHQDNGRRVVVLNDKDEPVQYIRLPGAKGEKLEILNADDPRVDQIFPVKTENKYKTGKIKAEAAGVKN